MEVSKDKTKRNMIKLLTDYEWLYQYSIFCDVSDLDYKKAKILAVEWIHNFNDIKFRDYLRKVNDTAILFILRVGLIRNRLDNKRIKQVYITMYANDKIKINNVESYFVGYEQGEIPSLNIMNKKVSSWQIEKTTNTLRKQALHNLDFLGNKKRYSVINRKYLVAISSNQKLDNSLDDVDW